MKITQLRLRFQTVLITVVVVALLIECVGLGRRSRQFAQKVDAATQAELVNRNVAANSKLAAAQAREEADRIQATRPVEAVKLREHADWLTRTIPFFEAQADVSAQVKQKYQRAIFHPWESEPPPSPRLDTTPPR